MCVSACTDVEFGENGARVRSRSSSLRFVVVLSLEAQSREVFEYEIIILVGEVSVAAAVTSQVGSV